MFSMFFSAFTICESTMPANTCDTDATTPFWATSTPLVCVSNLNQPNTKIEFLMFSVTLCEQLQPIKYKNWVSHFYGRITKKPFSIQVSCFVKTPRPQIAIKLRPNLCPAETLDQVSPPVFQNWALNWPDFRHQVSQHTPATQKNTKNKNQCLKALRHSSPPSRWSND